MSFFFKSFGCRVNQAEAMDMKAVLAAAGYCEAEAPEKSAVVIINSCTVTARADQKVRQYIKRVKKDSPRTKIILTGCMATAQTEQERKNTLVDYVVPNAEKDCLPERLKRWSPPDRHPDGGSLRMNKARALVKVQDGCQNFCSYCIIPYVRRRVWSQPPDAVAADVLRKLDAGFYEIVLCGINIGMYRYDETDIGGLVKKLLSINDLKRLRLSSIEPDGVSDELIEQYHDERICAHIHMPVQSGSAAVLKRMNRNHDLDFYYGLLKKLSALPRAMTIGTDIITGFPGESLEDLEASKQLMKSGFNYFHIFPYSPREGTPAAGMAEQLPMSVRKDRARELLALGSRMNKRFRESFIGKNVCVVIEKRSPDHFTGTSSEFFKVRVSEKAPGQIKTVNVRITAVRDAYLEGQTV